MTHSNGTRVRDIVLLLLSTFIVFGTFNMLLTPFPLYVVDLGGDENVVGILGGLFALGAVAMRPLFARLADRKGRKLVLMIAAFVTMTAPLLYIPRLGFGFLAVARLYHSISLAAFILASQTMLADLSTPKNRGMLFGIYGLATVASLAVTPAWGLSIVERMGYGRLFLITAALGIGAVAFSAPIGGQRPDTSAGDAEPVPFKRIATNKWVVVPSIALFTVTMAQGATGSFVPLHAVEVGLKNSAVFFAAFSVASVVGRLGAGQLSDRFGRKAIAAPSVFAVGIGLMLLTKLTGYHIMALSGLLVGGGSAAAHTVLLALVVDRTSPRERSQAVSFYANAFDLGTAAGSMAMGAVARVSFAALWGVMALFAFLGFALMSVVLPADRAAEGAEAGTAEKSGSPAKSRGRA